MDTRNSGYRFTVCAGLLAVVMAGCQPQEAAPKPGAVVQPADGATCQLRVEFGDASQKQFEPIAWSPGMTVIDMLRGAKAQGLDYADRGQGMTAFVESIDGVANTGTGKNWLFYVNGKKSERGAGAYELKADDEVLWKYTDEK